MVVEAAAGRELDLRGMDLTRIDLSGSERTWTGLVFGRAAGDRTATLTRATFAGSKLVGCRFVDVDLQDVDFTGCEILDCDFRYARLRRTRLTRTFIVHTDMFAADFGPSTGVSHARFLLVSPPSQWDHVIGLEWKAFAGVDGQPAHVAESAEVYRRFLQRTARQRLAGRGIETAMDERLENAARAYRSLAGYLMSQAQFRDAGAAYAHSQRLERASAGPLFRGRPFRPLAWLALWIADITCAFGESLGRVGLMLALVALLPALIFGLLDGVSGATGTSDYLLFSISRMVASTPERLQPSCAAVEWVATTQTFVGITLLGLFGFVLGNSLRRH